MRKQVKLSIVSLFFILGYFFLIPSVFAERDDLQELIDETPEDGVLELEATTYHGNIEITKPMTIVGGDGTHIRGDGTASVIEITADYVTIKNVHVSNSGTNQSSNEEYTGIRIMGEHTTIQNVKLTDVYHGMYLTRADYTTIDNVEIIGQATKSLAQQGNGIHIIRSANNTIINNDIRDTRDGIYVEQAFGNDIRNNLVQNTRYGLHYMYSDNNEFYDNRFYGNVGGAAIMQSDYLIIENNSFSYNQGSRSFGLLIQTGSNLEIRNNEFFSNQRGLYADMSSNNEIEGNKFFKNQIGIELWSSSTSHTFFANEFSQNHTDAVTVGASSFNNWFKNGVGNYWDTPMLDLDHNGIADSPYHYSSAISDLIEANELTYMFLNSPALGIYETMNAMASSQNILLEDLYPLINTDHSNVNLVNLLLGTAGILLAIIIVFYVRKRRRA